MQTAIMQSKQCRRPLSWVLQFTSTQEEKNMTIMSQTPDPGLNDSWGILPVDVLNFIIALSVLILVISISSLLLSCCIVWIDAVGRFIAIYIQKGADLIYRQVGSLSCSVCADMSIIELDWDLFHRAISYTFFGSYTFSLYLKACIHKISFGFDKESTVSLTP